MNVLDIFSGLGGFTLGLKRTGGFHTVAFCELDAFCRRVLAKNFPGVPIYDDVRSLSAARLRADGLSVDALCGGWPCQPFSTASRGRRVAIDMWPECIRLVDDIEPTCAIFENVSEQAITDAARDLAERGYVTDVRRIGAHDAGADHTRNRWWVSAHADPQGELRRAVDAEVARLPELCRGLWGPENYRRAIRVPDGIPHRLDDAAAVAALGNAVVPAIPQAIGTALLASLRGATPPAEQDASQGGGR